MHVCNIHNEIKDITSKNRKKLKEKQKHNNKIAWLSELTGKLPCSELCLSNISILYVAKTSNIYENLTPPTTNKLL